MKNNYITVDVETGGRFATPDPKTGEHNGITQISMRVIEPVRFKLLHTFDAFIKPYDNTTINPEALKYTRVTMKDINNGEDVNVVTKQIVETFKIANKGGRYPSAPILVGHNVEFDKMFLRYLFERKNKSLFDFVQVFSYDTMWLCMSAEAGKLKSDDVNRYTLTACCERFGISLKNAHNAIGDTAVTEQLFIKLLKRLNQQEGKTKDATQQTEKQSKSRDSFYFEI